MMGTLKSKVGWFKKLGGEDGELVAVDVVVGQRGSLGDDLAGSVVVFHGSSTAFPSVTVLGGWAFNGDASFGVLGGDGEVEGVVDWGWALLGFFLQLLDEFDVEVDVGGGQLSVGENLGGFWKGWAHAEAQVNVLGVDVGDTDGDSNVHWGEWDFNGMRFLFGGRVSSSVVWNRLAEIHELDSDNIFLSWVGDVQEDSVLSDVVALNTFGDIQKMGDFLSVQHVSAFFDVENWDIQG